VIDGGGDRGLGQFAEPAGCRPAVEDAGEIGKGHEESHPALDDAQPAHHLAFARRTSFAVRFPAIARFCNQSLDLRLQRIADGRGKDCRIEIGDFAQIGRERQDGGDKVAQRPLGLQHLSHDGLALADILQVGKRRFQFRLVQRPQEAFGDILEAVLRFRQHSLSLHRCNAT